MKEVRVGVRVTQLRVVYVETNSVLGPLTWLSIERGWPAYRIKFTVDALLQQNGPAAHVNGNGMNVIHAYRLFL